jgi:hypothetical protein
MPSRLLTALLGLSALFISSGATAAALQPVDVELIIAVDVSRSVDAYEGRLQREGYVAAFSDDQVIEAVTGGFNGRIAVLYFEWASNDFHKVVQDWTVIEDAATAKAFAARLHAAPINSDRRTAISAAIDWAVPRFSENDYEGKRKVIDVSGDGPNNFSRPVTVARDAAVAAGITINGLPIINDPRGSGFGGFGGLARAEDLAPYYENCVIGGRGAFIVVANGFEDFANAIRQKLVLEIAGLMPDKSPEKAAQAMLPAFRGLSRPSESAPPLRQVQDRAAISCETRFQGYDGGYGGGYGGRYGPD